MVGDNGIGLPCSRMLKRELHELIKQCKFAQEAIKVGAILAKHGQFVLQLPSYHADLSHIELI